MAEVPGTSYLVTSTSGFLPCEKEQRCNGTGYIYKEMLKEEEYPRYRIFLHDGKYDTLDNITDKWRTSTIEKLEYANYETYRLIAHYCDPGHMDERKKSRKILQGNLP